MDKSVRSGVEKSTQFLRYLLKIELIRFVGGLMSSITLKFFIPSTVRMTLSLIETEKLQEELVGSVPVKMSYLDMLTLSILYGRSIKEIRNL